jgi:hypothetical protein
MSPKWRWHGREHHDFLFRREPPDARLVFRREHIFLGNAEVGSTRLSTARMVRRSRSIVADLM